MSTDNLDTTQTQATPEPGTDLDKAPPVATAPDAGHQTTDDADLDLLADAGDDAGEAEEASDAQPASDEPKASPFLERPENLKDATAEKIEAWRKEQGLPAREEYQLPELDDGQHYTEYGKALAEKVTALGYDLDLSPTQTQQLVLKGNDILKALTESRDAEDARAGSKALLDEFDGDREAAKVHVSQARAALKKALPEGLSKVVLEARGPDGRKLAYNLDFLRWASQLGARPQAKGRTSMTDQLKAELAELTAVRDRDVSELYRPWRGSGKTGSDRMLEIQRQLDGAASAQARHTADRDAASDEERELLALHRSDPQFFEFGRWKHSGVSPSQRLYDLRQGRR